MAASKLQQKHLILGHVAYNHRTTMTPVLSFFLFKKSKMKIKKLHCTMGT